MREIKFRAWDKKKKEMLFIQQLAFDVYNYQKKLKCKIGFAQLLKNNKDIRWVETSKLVIMQYTGLKDKNGKEIYQGDIVENELNKKIGIVIYDNEYASFLVEEFLLSDGAGDFYGSLNKELKIIGNIYENPDLINN